MKRCIAVLAVFAACLVPAVASASPGGSHRCVTPPYGNVSASWATSCPFAEQIMEKAGGYDWYDGAVFGFTSWSPVTRRSYHITCRIEHVATCYSNGHHSWIKFRSRSGRF